VPKASVQDGDKPRRRRSTAVAVVETPERGLAMRILLYSPKDMVAGGIAFAAVSAIVANALFMQAGRHPAPMFGGSAGLPITALVPTSPIPRPRPADADTRSIDAKSPDAKSSEIKSSDAKSTETRPADIKPADSKPADSLASLVKSNGAPSGTSTSHRVAAVQRLLTEYGYGQLKPTGTVGSDTQAAIQKFERDRKIPVTGQMSDRLVHELTAMTGRSID
jgi:hypothetical protein